jgi:hypothetical protein
MTYHVRGCLLLVLASVILYSGIITRVAANHGNHPHGRLYTHQFEPSSEHLILPRIIAFSVYLGKLKYPHMRLLFESMRWNPRVQFVLINIVENEDRSDGDSADLIRLVEREKVDNFYLHVISCAAFTRRVEERLGISVAYNHSWGYKVGTDYKPTLAHLFPEILNQSIGAPPRNSNDAASVIEPYAYWGYVDIDLIFGNFSRFANIFQGQYAVITSDYQGASGVAMFFKNENWTTTMFRNDPLFTLLLKNHTDYQLDEFSRKGLFAESTMDNIIKRTLQARGLEEKSSRGIHWKVRVADQAQLYIHAYRQRYMGVITLAFLTRRHDCYSRTNCG